MATQRSRHTFQLEFSGGDPLRDKALAKELRATDLPIAYGDAELLPAGELEIYRMGPMSLVDAVVTAVDKIQTVRDLCVTQVKLKSGTPEDAVDVSRAVAERGWNIAVEPVASPQPPGRGIAD